MNNNESKGTKDMRVKNISLSYLIDERKILYTWNNKIITKKYLL